MKTLKILLLLALISPVVANAQCKKFTKKKCLPLLEEYIPNDNYISEVFSPGDEAEVNMTFFSGKSYRLFVCNQDILGEINYQVKDMEDNVVFDSKEDATPTFDFEVDNTLKLKVYIQVPDMESYNELTPEGCVAIIIGHKEEFEEEVSP